jgi:hypothetical protein
MSPSWGLAWNTSWGNDSWHESGSRLFDQSDLQYLPLPSGKTETIV